MAGWTLEQARTHLQAYLEADLALATGKSYKIGSRNLTRLDAAEVKERINFWSNEVERLENGRPKGIRQMRVVIRDL
jgi:uncharacterized small protein (DUF1192 family)